MGKGKEDPAKDFKKMYDRSGYKGKSIIDILKEDINDKVIKR